MLIVEHDRSSLTRDLARINLEIEQYQTAVVRIRANRKDALLDNEPMRIIDEMDDMLMHYSRWLRSTRREWHSTRRMIGLCCEDCGATPCCCTAVSQDQHIKSTRLVMGEFVKLFGLHYHPDRDESCEFLKTVNRNDLASVQWTYRHYNTDFMLLPFLAMCAKFFGASLDPSNTPSSA